MCCNLLKTIIEKMKNLLKFEKEAVKSTFLVVPSQGMYVCMKAKDLQKEK